MIKIDFNGSTHGHFLEYVSNVYIMRTSPGKSDLFNELGAAHGVDEEYLCNRLIECNHYSSYNIKFCDDDIVIRITINTNDDEYFFIALTNLMHRAGNAGIGKQLLSIPDDVRSNYIKFRNDWYSKFNERDIYISSYKEFPPLKQKVFEFPFSSFYSFPVFCKKLNQMAEFLNQRWFPDETLYLLWSRFIEKNQGWQSYMKCNKILESILSNTPLDFDCTIIEQSWINYNLSKIFRIFNGTMFDSVNYPSNTQDIYHELQQHLGTFK